ncbi:MAG: hypothetical protein Q4E53_10425 [Eubacteriales bacterium]|nr:hypothetical protein [Eubacteriales bacterium]
MEQQIARFEKKMKSCNSMTDLLIAMSSWQSFCERNMLTEEQRKAVDQAYIEAESRLITQVKPSLW